MARCRRPELGGLAQGRVLAAVGLLLVAGLGAAEPLRIAAASSVGTLARELAARLDPVIGVPVQVITAATGIHVAQIRSGAPYDLLLAAEHRRPAQLLAAGHGAPGGLRIFAHGRLAWYRGSRHGPVEWGGWQAGDPARIAIANPAHAPYGSLALQWLERLPRGPSQPVVRATSVAQAMSVVDAGAADYALVAASLVCGRPRSDWAPAGELELAHVALQLSDRPEAAAFLAALVGDTGRAVVQAHCLRLPTS